MPLWLIALGLAGAGYYFHNKNKSSGGNMISAAEYVDSNGIHWNVNHLTDGTWTFDTKGYNSDAGIHAPDQVSGINSVESFAKSHKPNA